jgi:hypothetical protein
MPKAITLFADAFNLADTSKRCHLLAAFSKIISVALYVKMGEAMRGVKIRQPHLAKGIKCLIFAQAFLLWSTSLCHSLVPYTVVGLLWEGINSHNN